MSTWGAEQKVDQPEAPRPLETKIPSSPGLYFCWLDTVEPETPEATELMVPPEFFVTPHSATIS